jgi:hypothetical protein
LYLLAILQVFETESLYYIFLEKSIIERTIRQSIRTEFRNALMIDSLENE